MILTTDEERDVWMRAPRDEAKWQDYSYGLRALATQRPQLGGRLKVPG